MTVTFENPATDADTAREALRGLVHATRSIAEPGDTYSVLGSLSAALASLGQSLDQLAEWHYGNCRFATNDLGSEPAGERAAIAAADNLHEAAGLIERARSAVDSAWNENGRIVWRPEAAAPPRQRRLPDPSLFGAGTGQRAVSGLAR